LEEVKISVELTKYELEVLIAAIGSANPVNKETEVVQFKLYHKLLFKLNEFK